MPNFIISHHSILLCIFLLQDPDIVTQFSCVAPTALGSPHDGPRGYAKAVDNH